MNCKFFKLETIETHDIQGLRSIEYYPKCLLKSKNSQSETLIYGVLHELGFQKNILGGKDCPFYDSKNWDDCPYKG